MQGQKVNRQGTFSFHHSIVFSCGLQSVVDSPRGNGCMGDVSGESLCTYVWEKLVRNNTAKFAYIGVFFHWRVWYTRLNKSKVGEVTRDD